MFLFSIISILNMTQVIMETSKGTLKFELYDNETPNTVRNFVSLIEKGFYDGLTFHRVIPNFVVQGGCPNGTGTGGPGYRIPCEVKAKKQYHDTGVLSMAHAGRNTGGSQFFIVLTRAQTAHLDGNHTCFGECIEGKELLPKFSNGDKMIKVTVEHVSPAIANMTLKKL